MRTQFRPTQSSDLKHILNFNLDRTELFYFSPSATYPLTLEQLEEQICKRHESIIMLNDKEIVGFANFYKVDKHNIAFIGNLLIKPEKRKQGLGKQLLQYMIKHGFTTLHLKQVHLSCYQDNLPALLLYKKLGFKAYAHEDRPDLNTLMGLPGKQQTQLIHLRISNLSSVN